MPFRRRAGFERCASSAKNQPPAVPSAARACSTTIPAIRPLVRPDSAHRRQRAPGNHCQPSTERLRRVGDSDDDPTHRLQTRRPGPQITLKGAQEWLAGGRSSPSYSSDDKKGPESLRDRPAQAMTRPRRWEESGERPSTECRTSGRGRSRPPKSMVNPNPQDER